ncbi:hypothetical protein BGU57_19125 [Clostridioides difficile]|nr:hypothetical protein BGU57_19125 [Clostridioides difficile]
MGWSDNTLYIMATVLPIDKLIGKIYPLFGAALLTVPFTHLRAHENRDEHVSRPSPGKKKKHI